MNAKTQVLIPGRILRARRWTGPALFLLGAALLNGQVPPPNPVQPRPPGAPAAPAGGGVVPSISHSTAPRLLPNARTNSIAIPSGVGSAPGLPTGPQIVIPPRPGMTNTNPEEIIAAGVIDFRGVELAKVLEIYASYVNKTILQPANLTAPPITLTTRTDLTKREIIEAFKAVLGMDGIALIDVPGDKFVKVVPLQGANQEAQTFDKTADPSQLPELGSIVTHVVQLKYTKPSELIQALQPFAKAAGGLTAIDSSQMLVIRDFSENVKRMLEVINEIDIAVPEVYVSEVIPIKYALASDIASALNSLSSGGGSTSVGARTTSGSRGGAGSSFGRSNVGNPGGGFGNPSYPGSTSMGTQPSPMSSSSSPGGTGSTFANRLSNLMNRVNQAGEIQIIGQTKIISDERTNSLLIYATREDMKIIKDIISKLDVVLAQVLIESAIISVEIGPNTSNTGVSWLQHSQSTGRLTGTGAAGAGQYFSPGDFVTGGGTNGAAALQSGFNYLASWGNDLDVTLTAVASDSHSKILQRPRIQTSHAVEAQIFVGQSRPYPTSSYYGGGAYGSYASIQQLEIGVTLDVTPLINTEGLVVMDIHQTIEDYAGSVTITGVGDVPITTRKEASAKVAVRDHDTIMLGGLIDDRKSDNNSGVPILKDIPLVGYLFRSSSTSSDRSELIVLIRPTVLPTPEVAALTATAEKAKMPGIWRAEKEYQAEESKMLKRDQELEKKSSPP